MQASSHDLNLADKLAYHVNTLLCVIELVVLRGIVYSICVLR